jgi:hypothetical protein
MRSRSAVYRRLCVGTRRAADQHRSSGFRHSGTGVPVRLLARIGRPSGRGGPGPDLSVALSVAERFGVRREGTYYPSEVRQGHSWVTGDSKPRRRYGSSTGRSPIMLWTILIILVMVAVALFIFSRLRGGRRSL